MLLNIPNIEQDTPATPNLWNERFGLVAQVLNGNVEADNIKNGSITAAKLAADVLDKFYPVGSLYFNATNDANPASLLGFGTWEAYSQGRMPVGYDAGQTEFNAPGKTGGAKSVILTEGQMPSHNHHLNDPGHSHNIGQGNVVFLAGSTVSLYKTGSSNATNQATFGNFNVGASATGIWLNNTGGNQAHDNMSPFITVYIWRRTA